MTRSTHHGTTTTGLTSVRSTAGGTVLTSPRRLCFIVEERYEHDVMPGAVVDVLRSWGHVVDVLDAAGAVGITTVNDHRAIRLARDKAVAAVRARAAGIPFPRTWLPSRTTLLDQIPATAYPLVVKPNNGSSCGADLPGGEPDRARRAGDR